MRILPGLRLRSPRVILLSFRFCGIVFLAPSLDLGPLDQHRTVFGRCVALVGLTDDDAAAVDLHILVLDDDSELVDLLFEFLHAAVQPCDLLGLDGHDLLGVLQLRRVGFGRGLARFERKKRMVPASPLASTKFRIRLSVSMIQGMYLWMERSRMR